MTNTGKVLIIGLLVVDVGVAGYLLYPKDERPPAATGVVTSEAPSAPRLDARDRATQMATGSVIRSAPPADGGRIVGAQPSRVIDVAPRESAAAPLAAAPAAPAVQAPAAPAGANLALDAPAAPAAPALPAAPSAALSANGGAPAPSPAVVAGQAQQSVQADTALNPKTKPTLRAQQVRGRRPDETRRGSSQVSTALTAELVRESAQPDPSLPLPAITPSAPATTTPISPERRSTNPVANAMTDLLVRESSKVPPPQYDKH